ncbi:PLP-dependent cysteine synthase family protein [Halopenitus persicus]|uniref:Cysteine synthase B n=1 Tax=Halopenitus persicus TaxID=1048396 RepID=A0A1H3FJJ9_9EURY|nr:pyridoxal-phosphate dependent enzyme [Halopenitus persicus]SDX91232.1 cysteine synthase B [Halopenitus persicus]
MAATADLSAVGNTPLIELEGPSSPTVYGKVEWFNQAGMPHGGGSIKSRIGKSMLLAAEAGPEPLADRTLLEASSGNTGAAVARFGAARGYDVEIVLPDDAGGGKVAAMEAAGAELVRIDADLGYDAYVEACRSRTGGHPDRYCYLDQYENPANPGVHAGTTGPEIWAQTDGAVDHFVAGAGTAGTLVGVGTALRDRGVDVHGYEPATDEHDIAGCKHMHTAGHYVPGTYDPAVVETMTFLGTETAHDATRRLRRRYDDRRIRIEDPGQWSRSFVREELRVDGEFRVGPSSGGALALVERLSDRGVFESDDVVVIPLADRGDRYPERYL